MEEAERGLVGGVLLSLGMISSPGLAMIMEKSAVFSTNGEVVADPAHHRRLLFDDGDESWGATDGVKAEGANVAWEDDACATTDGVEAEGADLAWDDGA